MTQHSTDYIRRVCNAMNYISRNLGRDLTLEEIAAEASFSPYHFHRIFKSVTGENIGAFIRRLRLQQAACRLIGWKQESVTEIALDCGFSSSQNFSKAFRQYYTMSPSEFRKSKKGNKLSKEGNDFSTATLYHPGSMCVSPTNEQQGRRSMKALIKEMDEYLVAYSRKMGAYGPEVCEQAFSELMRWAGPRGFLESGPVMAVYWDNPEVTPAEKCRVDACVGVPAGTRPAEPLGLQTISGGPYLVCSFEITSEGFPQAWDESFRWLMEQGYECADKPCYELYHNDASTDPEAKWLVDICIPLLKK